MMTFGSLTARGMSKKEAGWIAGAAPLTVKTVNDKKVVNQLSEKRTENYGIGQNVCLECDKHVLIQRQKVVLSERFKILPPNNQFSPAQLI